LRSVVRPISDFEPRERIVPIPHTTRRFACRSGLAISPDARTLAFVADLGAGTAPRAMERRGRRPSIAIGAGSTPAIFAP